MPQIIRCLCLTIFISLLVALTVGNGFAQSDATTAKTFAVVIGIARYPRLPGNQQLLFADRDALDFAAAMKKVCGDNVRLLVNQQATAEAIKAAVGDWLARSATENDTVTIYFSGHGITESEYGEAYLLAYDSDAKLPYSTGVSLRELSYAISRRVKAGRILIIADAVRREFFDAEIVGDQPTKIFTSAFNQLSQWRGGIATMLASSFGEYSREGQKWNSHGAFTNSLLEALNGGIDTNADGATNAEELFAAISTQLSKTTSKKQHPMKAGTTLAQFVLATKNSALAASRTPIEPRNQSAAQMASPPKSSTTSSVAQQSAAPSVNATPNEASATKPTPAIAATNAPNQSATKAESVVVEGAKNRQLIASAGTTETLTPTPPEAQKTAPATASTPPLAPANKIEAVKIATPETPPVEVAKAPAPSRKNVAASTLKPPKPPANKLPATRHGQPPPPNPATKAGSPTGIKTEMNAAPAPVKPQPVPPSIAVIATTNANPPTENMSAAIPVNVSAPAPSPLLLDFEAAITSGRLIEPRGQSAWDIYQQMTQQAALSAAAARLKPRLAEALFTAGKETLSADVRSDNIADKVEDFKRAGQILAKARTLTPEKSEIAGLEKLSATAALISLQFYDEAEKALLILAKTAATENALGIVYVGKLDNWKAERAFKNASELDANYAAPHYNLGLLYRAQKNDAALAEFEKAAALDAKNAAIFIAIGDEYFAQNKWPQATEAYRQAIAARPFDDALHTKLGHALYSQGLREEANKEYQKAKELRNRQ
ncbi:MAG: caspase family protein [Acidobacteria bacterium]|nr:caspase family protein [Acidobacteriota bacterium]